MTDDTAPWYCLRCGSLMTLTPTGYRCPRCDPSP